MASQNWFSTSNLEDIKLIKKSHWFIWNCKETIWNIIWQVSCAFLPQIGPSDHQVLGKPTTKSAINQSFQNYDRPRFHGLAVCVLCKGQAPRGRWSFSLDHSTPENAWGPAPKLQSAMEITSAHMLSSSLVGNVSSSYEWISSAYGSWECMVSLIKGCWCKL